MKAVLAEAAAMITGASTARGTPAEIPQLVQARANQASTATPTAPPRRP